MRYQKGVWVPPDLYEDPFKPSQTDYKLPIRVLDPNALLPEDGELLHAMAEYTPDTRFREGQIVYLHRCPNRMYLSREKVPRLWKIRWITCVYAYELHAIAQDNRFGEILGIDHAIALLDQQGHLEEYRYRSPLIYAHGFPHGLYPQSAGWFSESHFRPLSAREQLQVWEQVLDEAHVPFHGWDVDALNRPYSFDYAPDDYRHGENTGAPFVSEEATVHTLALLGMEDVLFRPIDTWSVGDPWELDPEHDVFADK